MAINEFLQTPLAWITYTFLIYWGATALQRATRLSLLSPMIVTIAVVIVTLEWSNTSFETYYTGGAMIEFWLKPAIVALALPLYQELRHIKSQFMTLFITELAGAVIGIVTVVLIARWLGATPDVIRSLAPKSVSTPVAIEICRNLGGIPALTSAIVVAVGMLGACCGAQDSRDGQHQGRSVALAQHGHGSPRHGHPPHQSIQRPSRCLRYPRPHHQRHPHSLPGPAHRRPPAVTSPHKSP